MIKYLLIFGIVVTLCLCGVFDTAVILFTNVMTQIIDQFLTMQRFPKFLKSNEIHNACMLFSSHKNSST